jgi:pimeloyl-ACP methyl ester carboxylesterase
LSLDAFVQDLEAVTDRIEDEAFDLIGISQGAPVAIAYAARHPERVRKLVLLGGFAMGWRHRASAEELARREAMITLTEFGWGLDNPAFRQMFTSLFVPRATPELADAFNQLQRVSASPHEAQLLQRAIGEFDVREHIGAVRAPTIVFHCRSDAMVPFAAGRQLAASIKDAEFVGLDSENHLLMEDEPAWQVFVEHLRDFLAR